MSFLVNGKEVKLEKLSLKGGQVSFSYQEKTYSFELVLKEKNKMVLKDKEGRKQTFYFDQQKEETLIEASFKGFTLIPKTLRGKSQGAKEGALLSPMPGKIFKVLKKEGEKVNAGDVILIVEAMKMEHAIKANIDGVITKLYFAEGAQVKGKAVLVELEKDS